MKIPLYNWQSPALIAETSMTSDTRIAVSGKGQKEVVHILWWDKLSDQPYTADHLPGEDSVSEIWYTTLENGKWTGHMKLFEGNHFIPKFTKSFASKEDGSLYFMFYAGQNDENDGIPSLYLAGKEDGAWQIRGPVFSGGGAEASAAQLYDDTFIAAYRGPGFDWAKENFESDWRGILLKISEDRGETWGEPFLIDRNEWKMTVTARPQIIADGNEFVHLFWRQDTTGDNQADNLVHTWTKDGVNWAEIELPGDRLADAAFIRNYDVSITPGGNMHLIYEAWTKNDNGTLVHSNWNGQNWSVPQLLFEGEGFRNPVMAFDDIKNRLHLVFQARNKMEPDQTGMDEWRIIGMDPADKGDSGYEHFTGWSWYHSVYQE